MPITFSFGDGERPIAARRIAARRIAAPIATRTARGDYPPSPVQWQGLKRYLAEALAGIEVAQQNYLTGDIETMALHAEYAHHRILRAIEIMKPGGGRLT